MTGNNNKNLTNRCQQAIKNSWTPTPASEGMMDEHKEYISQSYPIRLQVVKGGKVGKQEQKIVRVQYRGY